MRYRPGVLRHIQPKKSKSQRFVDCFCFTHTNEKNLHNYVRACVASLYVRGDFNNRPALRHQTDSTRRHDDVRNYATCTSSCRNMRRDGVDRRCIVRKASWYLTARRIEYGLHKQDGLPRTSMKLLVTHRHTFITSSYTLDLTFCSLFFV